MSQPPQAFVEGPGSLAQRHSRLIGPQMNDILFCCQKDDADFRTELKMLKSDCVRRLDQGLSKLRCEAEDGS